MALNDKQEIFCEEYAASLNATKAAIKAGYSEKTAYSQGHDLLKNPEIRERIQTFLDIRMEQTRVTQERVVRELARIAFGDPRDVMEWGWLGAELKNSADLTPDQAAMVAGVVEKRSKGGVTLEVKFHDKLAALEKLGKYLNMFVDKSEVLAVVTTAEPSVKEKAILQHFVKHYADRAGVPDTMEGKGAEDGLDLV